MTAFPEWWSREIAAEQMNRIDDSSRKGLGERGQAEAEDVDLLPPETWQELAHKFRVFFRPIPAEELAESDTSADFWMR